MMVCDSESPSSDDDEIVPQAIRDAAKQVSLNLLPEKSKRLYTAAYNTFKKWRRENGSNSFCQDVLLAYFADLSKHYSPPSCWSTYSMLKCTINSYDQVDIGRYKRLYSFLKKYASGYVSKKAAVFTSQDISKYINEAPDEVHLCKKVTTFKFYILVKKLLFLHFLISIGSPYFWYCWLSQKAGILQNSIR